AHVELARAGDANAPARDKLASEIARPAGDDDPHRATVRGPGFSRAAAGRPTRCSLAPRRRDRSKDTSRARRAPGPGRPLQDGEVAVHLPLRELDPVLIPLLALDLDVAIEDV